MAGARVARLAVWLCLTSASSLAAQAQPLTPLMNPPSSERHVGKFIFAELVTPDLIASKRFYGGLFGWTFRELKLGETDYAEASVDGDLVAGLAQRSMRADQTRQPAWLAVLSAADVDVARKRVLAQGGRVLVEPHERAGRGRFAVFADPQGAVFGVLASGSGDPPEELATPGQWIWHTLMTRENEAAVAFYQDLFDYEAFALPLADGSPDAPQQPIVASSGYARASVSEMPSNWFQTQTHYHWLGYIRVADAAQAVARALALGGRLLLPPRPDRHGGRLAIVADPQGAPVGLLEWLELPDERAAP